MYMNFTVIDIINISIFISGITGSDELQIFDSFILIWWLVYIF